MPITRVRFSDSLLQRRAPLATRRFLRQADRRIEAFQLRLMHEGRTSAFIPSDYLSVYQWLQAVARRSVATGNAFLEWGSGFGVIAGLAALLGFESWGIESDPELVEQSQQLLLDADLDVELACGSYIPPGGEDLAVDLTELERLDLAAPSAYEDLDRQPSDFDLIFAYPWPGQDRFLVDLFEHYAAPGALLLMYRGIEDIHLIRKR